MRKVKVFAPIYNWAAIEWFSQRLANWEDRSLNAIGHDSKHRLELICSFCFPMREFTVLLIASFNHSSWFDWSQLKCIRLIRSGVLTEFAAYLHSRQVFSRLKLCFNCTWYSRMQTGVFSSTAECRYAANSDHAKASSAYMLSESLRDQQFAATRTGTSLNRAIQQSFSPVKD